MDFLKLVKKKESKFDFKIAIALLVLAILLVLVKILSPQPDVYARDFLPVDTNFYYHWSNKVALSQDSIKLFDTAVPNGHLDSLRSVLGINFAKVEEVIWFTIDGDVENNYYLLRFSKFPKKYLEGLQNSSQDYHLWQPSDNILLLSDSEEAGDRLPELVVPRFAINKITQGINIYWMPEAQPEFLSIWRDWLPEMVLARDVFVNLQTSGGHLRLNLYQLRHKDSLDRVHQLSAARLPADFSLISGFQASSTITGEEFISRDIILPLYNALPYYNLNQQEIKDFILTDNILVQDKEDWLLVGADDWQSLAIDLAKDFELQEVTKLLPDGTTYVELLASDTQTVFKHDFEQWQYWQIDGLYGISLDNLHYLSNKAGLIEEIIINNRPLGSFFGDCLYDRSYQIGDFVKFNTNQTNDSALKTYLISKDIDWLEVFSYQNAVVEGLQLCF